MAAFPGSAPNSLMSSNAPSTDNRGPPQRLVYGRRQAARLKPRHKRLLDDLLPSIEVRLPDPLRRATLAELGIDDGDRPLWLEIGFGGGEHLAAIAADRPDVLTVGVEPFVTGAGKLLAAVEARGLANLRLFVNDARLLLYAMPDGCLQRAFILFPDPWPKLRHHKRRIVNDRTVAELARLLAPGGELRIATDHADYLSWILATMRRQPAFAWLAERPGDWRERPGDWHPTRYEAKAKAAGRDCVYLRYRRRC